MSDVFAAPNEPNARRPDPTGEIDALLALRQALGSSAWAAPALR